MLPASLLIKKRNGLELSDDEIRFLIEGFVQGTVADYQMSAFAMAVCLKGMTPRETATLTRAMLESGDRLPRKVSDETNRPRIDKHSTGGLGDKVSLILAPMLAECGADVPMISGRGLGLTGGTLDKLDAIPGYRSAMSIEESDRVLKDVGTFIVGASERVAPADRKLYSLRDVTGTVDSVPLITASILSKKLAASLDALVMDVKVGEAAFMTTLEDATDLSESLIRVGEQAGLPTSVIISDMDQPLGQAVGNAIEVNEAIDVLQGNGPAEVRELSVELAANLLQTLDDYSTRDAAVVALEKTLDSGAAMERFERMVVAQGGKLSGKLPLAAEHKVLCKHSGYVASFDCRAIGRTVVAMGGGRRKVDDTIDPLVGIQVHARIGDSLEKGQPIFTVHCREGGHSGDPSEYVGALQSAFELTDEVVASRPLILKRLSQADFS